MQRSRWSARRVALVAIGVAVAGSVAVPAGAATARVRLGRSAPEDWIVLFDEDVTDVRALAQQQAEEHGAKITYLYDGTVKGFAATFKRRVPGRQAMSWDPRVSLIERDRPYTFAADPVTQAGATPGLDRIDEREISPLGATFTYTNTGAGVTAYVLDTGVMGTHDEFKVAGGGTRVQTGVDATSGGLLGLFASKKPKPGNKDCNGHGTHVAGTIGGTTYGVAKAVAIVPVKVLSCSGSGTTAGIIKGIEWVTNHHTAGPAVANMSLGGGPSAAIDQAVSNSIADGITYAIAAGNSDADACGSSPAAVPGALTIGATDPLTDTRASFSNHGPCVDWFAPGLNITSAGTSSRQATAVLSGTSMAAPHVAGVGAQYLQTHPTASPDEVRAGLFSLTTKGVVKDPKSANAHLLFTNL